jgi:hypothetical protein
MEPYKENYKYQTRAASLTTNAAKPASLMERVDMSGPMSELHTYAHHQITRGLTKTPNTELGA